MRTMEVHELLRRYVNGDETSWESEFCWLYEHHRAELNTLRADVRVNGILQPVALGNDGRIWDGHHRLCIAVELGIERVPVMEMR